VVREQPTAPALLRETELTTQAALLIELHDVDESALATRLAAAEEALRELKVVDRVELTTEDQERNALVELRRGLYALVAGARTSGTTTLLEDICVPLEQFASMCSTLDELFMKFGYDILDVPLFAHARDGNIHFLLSERFDEQAGLLRYRRFARALVRQVLRHGGVLKAEHGTGRAMAPFVNDQYGDELYDVMREIKHLFDPAGVLNPGVIISEDPDIHLKHLKLMPTIEPEVDQCIECGFCEPGCPSRDLTLTPRQRIVLRRELTARRDDRELVAQVAADYEYEAIETCTAAGMCAVHCPLGIDTGELVRNQRAERAHGVEKRAWNQAAKSWGLATRMGSAALTSAKSAGPIASVVAKAGRKALGSDAVPTVDRDLPAGSGLRRRPKLRDRRKGGVAAYFPSCLQTMLRSPGQGVFSAFDELCRRAGVPVRLLDAADLCCGAPWKSKGLVDGYETMREKVRGQLRSREGMTVVCDSSSCTAALMEMAEYWNADVLDVVVFAARELLPRLTVTAPIDSIALHPTCTSSRLGINDSLLAIAEFISDDVVVPASWACCGFAGDRGLLHPELTASATAEQAAEIGSRQFAAYASCNRTCELGMSRATGQPYVHVLELLAQATR
jgi:D-lactate dehydrogenase